MKSELRFERQCKKKVFIDRYYRALTGQELLLLLLLWMDVRVRMCTASAFLHISLHVCMGSCCKQNSGSSGGCRSSTTTTSYCIQNICYNHSYNTTTGLPLWRNIWTGRNPVWMNFPLNYVNRIRCITFSRKSRGRIVFILEKWKLNDTTHERTNEQLHAIHICGCVLCACVQECVSQSHICASVRVLCEFTLYWLSMFSVLCAMPTLYNLACGGREFSLFLTLYNVVVSLFIFFVETFRVLWMKYLWFVLFACPLWSFNSFDRVRSKPPLQCLWMKA